MFFTLIERNMTRTFVALCAVGGLWAVILAVLAQAWRMSTVTVEGSLPARSSQAESVLVRPEPPAAPWGLPGGFSFAKVLMGERLAKAAAASVPAWEPFAENEQLLSLTCIFVALIALGMVGARLVACKPRAPAVFDLDRELDQIIGLEPVKERIRELRDELEYDKTLRRAGLPALSDQASLHMVFQGNPGTGKTSVARLVARLFVEMGVLKGTRTGAPFVEVKRSELIGSAVGETEKKTSAVIERARGGVLFVDEAYMLTNRGSNDFGPAAVEEIMNHMQDAEEPIFIFAGYPKEMEQFLLTNPGLQRRIGHTFEFADYDVRDLAKIFTREVRSKELELGSALSEDLLSCILHDYHPTDRSKFNAALITTRFIPEVAKAKRKRTCRSDDARVLGTITLEDVLMVIADHDQSWPRRADDINQRILELATSGSPVAAAAAREVLLDARDKKATVASPAAAAKGQVKLATTRDRAQATTTLSPAAAYNERLRGENERLRGENERLNARLAAGESIAREVTAARKKRELETNQLSASNAKLQEELLKREQEVKQKVSTTTVRAQATATDPYTAAYHVQSGTTAAKFQSVGEAEERGTAGAASLEARVAQESRRADKAEAKARESSREIAER